jgi:CDP-diacylglycerol--glycerol-3-phosphate 3-phosphatidyltransferase
MNTKQDSQWDINNLPNRLTIFRVILVPIIVLLYIPQVYNIQITDDTLTLINYTAGLIFILAAITDFFDGFFARRRNIVTVFGSFLDPIADKFLVVTSLIILQALNRVHPFIVMILIMREFYITSLRLLASGHQLDVPVSYWGKVKTAVQMVAIPLLFVNDTFQGFSTLLVGSIFIYTASALSLFSALQYSAGLIRMLRKRKKEKLQRGSSAEADHKTTQESTGDSSGEN